jgi:hypothetical protein
MQMSLDGGSPVALTSGHVADISWEAVSPVAVYWTNEGPLRYVTAVFDILGELTLRPGPGARAGRSRRSARGRDREGIPTRRA